VFLMPKVRRGFALAMLLAGLEVVTGFARAATPSAAPADFSGVWVPVAGATDPLVPDRLRMTERAKTALAAFDPRHHDSTRFCMPYGTPRNTLSTAPYPLEIVQRPERLTMIFDRLGDVRRVFLDGRARPNPLWPTWLGHSLGHWEGKTLVIETLALTKESILSDGGLPHSEDMRVVERLSLASRDGVQWLVDDMTITDPAMYDAPIKVTQRFRRSDGSQLSEGSVLCLVDQWRQDLERRNQTLADKSPRAADKGAR
jgi:hypothetical protein